MPNLTKPPKLEPIVHGWEIARADDAHKKDIDNLLRTGWKPFAATTETILHFGDEVVVTVYHFRKEKDY
jgi:hypothetical protein